MIFLIDTVDHDLGKIFKILCFIDFRNPNKIEDFKILQIKIDF